MSENLFSKRYLTIYLAVLSISILFMAYGLLMQPIKIPENQIPSYSSEGKPLMQVTYEIFINNLPILIASMVPFIGAIYTFYQSLILGSMLSSISPTTPILTLISILTNPIVYLEFSAYSFASASTIVLLLNFNPDITLKRLGFSILVLVISAFFEAIMLTI